jgi:hypothetical protein
MVQRLQYRGSKMPRTEEERVAKEQVRIREEVQRIVPPEIYEGWILREASEVFIRILHEIRINAQKIKA